MKKLIVLLLGVAILAIGISAFAGISSTKHNLTTAGFFTTKTTAAIFSNPTNASDTTVITVCSFCHIPHGANITIAGAPLWSRGTPNTAGYSVYGSGSAGGTSGLTLGGTPVGIPGAQSLTCLSCHDGTISVGAIYKNTVLLTAPMTGDVNANGMLVKPSGNTSYNADFTQDLRNDHPIGLVYDFGYPTPQNTAGLSTTISVSGPPFYVTVGGNNVFPIYGGTIGVGTLECASCHDPHTTAQPDFLRDAPTTICQDCHVNK